MSYFQLTNGVDELLSFPEYSDMILIRSGQMMNGKYVFGLNGHEIIIIINEKLWIGDIAIFEKIKNYYSKDSSAGIYYCPNMAKIPTSSHGVQLVTKYVLPKGQPYKSIANYLEAVYEQWLRYE